MAQSAKYLILATITIIALSACSSTPTPPIEKNALYYFQKGEMELDDGNYKEAIKDWEKVRDSFASPELTALAELKIADTQYANELYVEAIASYEDFLKQHPANIRKSDALLRLGKSHFNLMLSADRDQTATRNALSAFEQLKKNFPGKVNPQELDGLISQCRNRLAENASYIGHFYLITKHYAAAIERLEQVRTIYSDFSDMKHVVLDLAKAYQLNGNREKAEQLFDQIARTDDADLREEAAKWYRKHK